MRRNFLALSALLAAAHGLPDAFPSGCPRFKSKECAGHGRCVAALGGPVCQCEAGFERADCSMASFCPKDCSGRGHCTHPRGLGTANNPIAGTCACYHGFRGEACEEIEIPPQPYGCADFCSGHGRCVCEQPALARRSHVVRLATGEVENTTEVVGGDGDKECHCACREGYGGPTCAAVVPSASRCPNGCSGHGSCGPICAGGALCADGASGCTCDLGFGGADCSQVIGDVGCPANCSGHGRCVDGRCECDKHFAGAACDQVHVPPPGPNATGCDLGCSGHGLCAPPANATAGGGFTCECANGFGGRDCAALQPECASNCSARGVCLHGVCACVAGAAGATCDKVTKAECTLGCSGHGSCLKGVCVCDAGYEGAVCDRAQFPLPGCVRHCSGYGHCLPRAPPTRRQPLPDDVAAAAAHAAWVAAGGHPAPSPPPLAPEPYAEGTQAAAEVEKVADAAAAAATAAKQSIENATAAVSEAVKGALVPALADAAQEAAAAEAAVTADLGDAVAAAHDHLISPPPPPPRPPPTAADAAAARDAKELAASGAKPSLEYHGPIDGTGAGAPPALSEAPVPTSSPAPSAAAAAGLVAVPQLRPLPPGHCVCVGGFGGLDCSTPEYPCPSNCSGHGLCYADPLGDEAHATCHCARGYAGEACEMREERCPNDCSGHGRCEAKNRKGRGGARGWREEEATLSVTRKARRGIGLPTVACVCDRGYGGADCGAECPSRCSGHGICVGNASAPRCDCDVGWHGAACAEETPCPRGCSGNGQCVRGICSCDEGWEGEDCAIDGRDFADRPSTCAHQCSGNGRCNEATRKCECMPGYTGADCAVAPGERVERPPPPSPPETYTEAADAADVANSVVSGLHDALTPSQVALPADLFAEGRPQLRRAR